MKPMIIDESQLNLEEKWLCLDFANTMDWHTSDHPEEMLNSFPDLVQWGQEKGLIPAGPAEEMRAEAARRPEAAQQALQRAVALREAIFRLLQAHLAGQVPQAGDLDLLNQALAAHAAQRKLAFSEERFSWAHAADSQRLDWILGPIAQSAAGLLTSDELSRVGICADETGCGWAFYDTSRNRSRRWCDMRGCGNRAKARGHYARKKQVISEQ